MPAGDAAKVSVFVKVPPADAFDIFTKEIDLWWGQGPKYRIGGRRPGQLSFECRPGGRLLETVELSSGPRTFVIGTILAWEPPERLAFEWRGVNFKPQESTRVEVLFQPSGDGTLVVLEHRGWASLPEGHPARHGLTGRELSRMIGLWWGELMSSLREHAAAPLSSSSRPKGSAPGSEPRRSPDPDDPRSGSAPG